jgi:glutamate-1-semialdehyde aminotransferase
MPKIDPVYTLGGLFLFGLFALNGRDNLSAMQQQQSLLRATTLQNQQSEMQAKLASASAQRKAAIAQKRYEDGCQMVFASNAPGNFASIQDKRPVLDNYTTAVLPDGVIVCDHTGMTAIIRNGVADDLAFASDRQVVRDAMKRYADAQYSAPKL